jgi:hypothetical protein
MTACVKCGRPLFDFEAARRDDGDYCPDCPPEAAPRNPDWEHDPDRDR